jgi:predicted GNAT superfamily acetyltransferase
VSGHAADFSIRALSRHDELIRCVDFQRRIWGADFAEIVPAAILWVATRTGGIVAGAFDAAGSMVGFLFGMAGWVDERPVHWSDMLAVDPVARGRGLGTLLKRYQRDTLLDRGVQDVFWTFEPLESRNAYMNFAHLGITVREYVRDCYGVSESPLHQGLGTDRLIAHWALASERVRNRMEARNRMETRSEPQAGAAPPAAPVVNDGSAPPRLELDAAHVRIRIPADIQALKQRDPSRAALWRRETRAAFEAYLGRGYEATELIRDTEETSSYLLSDRALLR